MRKKIWRTVLLIFSIANWRFGLLALPVIGGMVFLVNNGYGILVHNDPGLKKALEAGFVAGFTGIPITATMSGFIQLMTVRRKYWLGVVAPCSVTTILHLPGQFANNTPNLFWSVIAPVILTFVTAVILMPLTRRYMTDREWGWLSRLLKPFFKFRDTNPDPE